jgi:hypothetical protein
MGDAEGMGSRVELFEQIHRDRDREGLSITGPEVPSNEPTATTSRPSSVTSP